MAGAAVVRPGDALQANGTTGTLAVQRKGGASEAVEIGAAQETGPPVIPGIGGERASWEVSATTGFDISRFGGDGTQYDSFVAFDADGALMPTTIDFQLGYETSAPFLLTVVVPDNVPVALTSAGFDETTQLFEPLSKEELEALLQWSAQRVSPQRLAIDLPASSGRNPHQSRATASLSES